MLVYKENALNVDIYLYLRSKVNWKVLTKEQAEIAVERCLYNIVVFDDNQPVGMGRIVGDGAVISYIQDLIVIPEYQGKKIGSGLIEYLKKYVISITMDGSEMMLCLMCAKGREKFYEHHDFIARPTEKLGPGMIQYIRGEGYEKKQ